MFSELSITSWIKQAAIVSVAALLLASGYKGYTAVKSHFDHIKQVESANDTLIKDNNTLKGNNSTLSASLAAQEAEVFTLQQTLKKRENERQQYEAKQAALEQDLQKQREESKNEIDAINRAIRVAGLSHTALPDSVVRMLKERAKAVNARGRDSDQSGRATAAKAAALPAVPAG